MSDAQRELDPGTATRAALGEEIERLRLQLVERNDAVQFMTRMRDKAEWERDAARRDLAAATTALADATKGLLAMSQALSAARALCNEWAAYGVIPAQDIAALRAVLDAAGDDPAANRGQT